MTTTLETFQSLFNGNTKNKSYRTDSGKVHTIDWNVDGSRLASGSLDKSVVIFAYDGKGSMVGKSIQLMNVEKSYVEIKKYNSNMSCRD